MIGGTLSIANIANIAKIAKIAKIANIESGANSAGRDVGRECLLMLAILAILARLRWSAHIPADRLRRGLAGAPLEGGGA